MTYLASLADKPSRCWLGRFAAAAAASLGLHLLALFIALALVVRPDTAPVPLALSVHISEEMPVPPRVETAIAPPPANALSAMPRKAPAPRKVVVTTVKAQSASSQIVPPDEPRAVVPLTETSPVPSAPFLPARFAADYLNNPEPDYPAISRRLGEQGKVVLSVRVSARGDVLAVNVSQSSGLKRLDDAAVAAVARWRFVPARLGGETVESNVLVPLRFSLGN